jgi:hypothetical protein
MQKGEQAMAKKYMGMELIAYTEANLDADEAWVSDLANVGMAAEVCGTLFADQDCTLLIEMGSAADKLDYAETVNYTANAKLGFDTHIFAPYVKVTVTNADEEAATETLRCYVYAKYTCGDPVS